MAMTFAEHCPVFARASASMPPPPSSMPQQPTPYPMYPTGPTTSGQLPYPIPRSGSNNRLPYSAGAPTVASRPAPPPPRPVSTATPVQSSNSGTIQHEYIRASLLSAVEDRLKVKVAEQIGEVFERRRSEYFAGVSFAELQSVRRTRDELAQGEQKLKAMLQRLTDEESRMVDAQQSLLTKKAELTKILSSAPKDGELNIGGRSRPNSVSFIADEVIGPTTPLHRQLLRAFVEDSALEDAIYYLGQALKQGTVTLDVYLKKIRDLSRQQFTARATMHKCRQVAGLNA